MKSVKRIIIIALAVVLGVSAGCGTDEASNSESKNSVSQTSQASSSENKVSQTDQVSSPESETSQSGNDMVSGNLKFTIDKVITTKLLKGENEYLNDKANDGKAFVIIEMTAENIGDENDYVNPLYFSASSDDISISDAVLLNKPDGLEMFSGDIMSGKKRKGYLAYKLEENWKSVEISYTEVLDNKPAFTYTVNRSDAVEQ